MARPLSVWKAQRAEVAKRNGLWSNTTPKLTAGQSDFLWRFWSHVGSLPVPLEIIGGAAPVVGTEELDKEAWLRFGKSASFIDVQFPEHEINWSSDDLESPSLWRLLSDLLQKFATGAGLIVGGGLIYLWVSRPKKNPRRNAMGPKSSRAE